MPSTPLQKKKRKRHLLFVGSQIVKKITESSSIFCLNHWIEFDTQRKFFLENVLSFINEIDLCTPPHRTASSKLCQ